MSWKCCQQASRLGKHFHLPIDVWHKPCLQPHLHLLYYIGCAASAMLACPGMIATFPLSGEFCASRSERKPSPILATGLPRLSRLGQAQPAQLSFVAPLDRPDCKATSAGIRTPKCRQSSRHHAQTMGHVTVSSCMSTVRGVIITSVFRPDLRHDCLPRCKQPAEHKLVTIVQSRVPQLDAPCEVLVPATLKRSPTSPVAQ